MVADRSVKVLIKGDVSDFNRAMLAAGAASKGLARDLAGADDRMGRLVETALTIGPALVPITAAAIPAISGLSNELAIAALGAGVAALAFQGIGTALTATNAYAIDPTAANLKKMNVALNAVGPAGEQFVGFLQTVRPEVQKLQNIAGAGLFPGLEAGMKSLTSLGPQVERIISGVAQTLGQLASEAGSNLGGPAFTAFFDFLERTARPTLIALGRTIGNFALAFANLWKSFEPLSNNFSAGFLKMSQDFAQWTAGLDKTQGFQDFLAYLERIGPKVRDTLASLGNALVGFLHAVAPVGEISLPIIAHLADVFAKLANSPIGPLFLEAAAAMAVFSRAAHIVQALNATKLLSVLNTPYQQIGSRTAAPLTAARPTGPLTTSQRLQSLAVPAVKPPPGAGAGAYAAAGAGALAFGLILTGTAQKLNLTNTASLVMAGSLLGPWGAAVGAGIGLIKDFGNTNQAVESQVTAASTAIKANAGSLKQQRDGLEKIAALAKLQQAAGDHNAAAKTSKLYAENAAQYKKNAAAAQDLLFKEHGLSAAMAGSSASVRAETAALLKNIDTKNQIADEALSAANAELNYRDALVAAQQQAKHNNAGIKGNSAAARANYHSLLNLAGAWNQVADSGKGSTKGMISARRSFIAVAKSMGVSIPVARALARELFHIPSPKPKVTILGEGAAKHTIQVIKSYVDGLHGKTIYINVIRNDSTGSTLKGGGNTAYSKAEGGYIRGPGTSTSDSIPAWLSDREYVIRASAVAKYGKNMFDRLNAGAYANGGQVQRFGDNNGQGHAYAYGRPEFAASLVGARVEIGKDGFGRFVDGRIEVAALRSSMSARYAP